MTYGVPPKTSIYLFFIVFSLTQVAQASAVSIKEESPVVMSNYSKCKDKELWKTRKSNTEICTKQSGKSQWEPALTNNDVYQVSDFCTKIINANQCEWTERAGLALVRGQGARDACIKLLREVVYAIANANKLNTDPNGMAGEAITRNKKFCYNENSFPK